VSQAINHFSHDLGEPFDLAKASLALRPVPNLLKDNIIISADIVARNLGLQKDTEKLLSKFTNLVASCILLDISKAAAQRSGNPLELFDSADTSVHDGGSGDAAQSYQSLCSKAISQYYDEYALCAGP